MIITNKEKVIRYKLEEDIATINSREFYIDNNIKLLDDEVYIPKEILETHYPLEIKYFEDTKAVLMEEPSNYLQGQIILEGGNIRTEPHKKNLLFCLKTLQWIVKL